MLLGKAKTSLKSDVFVLGRTSLDICMLDVESLTPHLFFKCVKLVFTHPTGPLLF